MPGRHVEFVVNVLRRYCENIVLRTDHERVANAPRTYEIIHDEIVDIIDSVVGHIIDSDLDSVIGLANRPCFLRGKQRSSDRVLSTVSTTMSTVSPATQLITSSATLPVRALAAPLAVPHKDRSTIAGLFQLRAYSASTGIC